MIRKILSIVLAVTFLTLIAGTALAAEFTPSVENKQAPEIVKQIGSDGKEYAAIIFDKDGNELAAVPEGRIVITPYSQISTLPDDLRERMESAYQQLQSTDDPGELSAELESVVKEVSPDLTTKDLVVRDFFDIHIEDGYGKYIEVEGAYIVVRLNLSADAESLAAVLHSLKEGSWETVTNDRITRNDDFTADIVFYSLSPVALLFDGGELGVDPSAPNSPSTGDPMINPAFVIAAAVVAAAAVVYFVYKKSGHKA